MIRDVLSACQHMHVRSIVHCGISPSSRTYTHTHTRSLCLLSLPRSVYLSLSSSLARARSLFVCPRASTCTSAASSTAVCCVGNFIASKGVIQISFHIRFFSFCLSHSLYIALSLSLSSSLSPLLRLCLSACQYMHVRCNVQTEHRCSCW